MNNTDKLRAAVLTKAGPEALERFDRERAAKRRHRDEVLDGARQERRRLLDDALIETSGPDAPEAVDRAVEAYLSRTRTTG